MIIITGGAGFIGSAVVAALNAQGVDDILIVDDLGSTQNWKNLRALSFRDYLHKDAFREVLQSDNRSVLNNVEGIIHLGACSSTTETNVDYLIENNYRYSCLVAAWAVRNNVRCIYASSAATYGAGEAGYDDTPDKIKSLRPLNPYGYSKQLFDQWVLRHGFEKNLVGLKFFNVFGPNEYHKGPMQSMVRKAYDQILTTGKVKLFCSNSSSFPDGGQKRDFIYIKDCTPVMLWLLEHKDIGGIYNLGSGTAQSWNDLARAVFKAMGKPEKIEYIPMPAEIAGQYQNFTEATMTRLQQSGAPFAPRSLSDAVTDYVQGYLMQGDKHIGA